MDQKRETQPIESLSLNKWEIQFFPIFPQEHPQVLEDMDNDEERVEISILTLENMSGMVGTSSPHTMSDLVAYIDGGSLGNPGPSGIGVVIDGSTDGTIRIAKWIGHQDNNVAEYLALLEALQCALGLKSVRENWVVPPGLRSFFPLFPALKRWAKLVRPSGAAFSSSSFHRIAKTSVLTHTLKAEALHVFSDSEVMVKQMKGEYSCRSPRLYSLNWTCRKLARSLDFSISHVRRANNAEANRLASSAARSVE
jgi:ribonuclease HI